MSHIDYASQLFGFDPPQPEPPPPAILPMPESGQVLAVIGPSGAGKTLALRALMTRESRELTPIRSEDLATPLLELFDPALPGERVLRTLARTGLADGRLWRLSAGCLSAGERRRLELALAACAVLPGDLLVADEFDAHLDAATARVIAQNLGRLAVRLRLRVACSTHRPEVLPFLAPARLFEIDAGLATELPPPPACELVDQIEIVQGSVRDYDAFRHWHYLGRGRPGPSSLVLVARHNGRPVGIAMFGYPHLLLAARGKALPQFAPARIRAVGAGGLNANVRLLQRVVVDPRFRGVSVAQRLIRRGLIDLGVPYVECIAQMGAFSGFLTRAGFRRLGDIAPPPAARKLVEFARRLRVEPSALVDATRRATLLRCLPPRDAAKLERLLHRLLKSRIQTGNGWLRGKPGAENEPLLRKALSRITARPAYYLWCTEDTHDAP